MLKPGERKDRSASGSGSMDKVNSVGSTGSRRSKGMKCSTTSSFDMEVQSGEAASSASNQTHNSDSNGFASKDLEAQHSQASAEDIGIELDFLGGGAFSFGRPKHWWVRWFPWFVHDEHANLKSTILGSASGTSSKSSAAAVFCPCLDIQSRQKTEFIQEMRLLSR